MNYQALGEYHAYKKQAEDAANTRFAMLHNLSMLAGNLAKNPAKMADFAEIHESVKQIEAADDEMNAAIDKANQAAPLCGEKTISAEMFTR